MIALLLAAGTVAVLPVEARTGSLTPADAAALTAQLRATARETLAPLGWSVTETETAEASAVVRSRAAQMEGATVVGVGVYKAGAAAPASLARVLGIGIAQLEQDVRAKFPKLLLTSLGLAAPVQEPPQRPGTLRMPPPAPQKSAAAPAPAAPPPADADPLVTLIREVTADVEKLRGLHRKENLKVEILDDTLFSKALREKANKELAPAVVAAERARWMAFDLAPPGADPGQILLEVLDEQVAGFYDPFSKKLFVRKEPPASTGPAGADAVRIVLAHEIEHALQDQNFGIPDLRTLPDDDVRLARSALLEGDAMAVMTAYAAVRAGRPVKAAIAAGASVLRAVDTETLIRMSGKSPALASAPAILREELVLPYAAGFALVAEAYRRGGFALVDKMFQHPPISSHQILHPEAYFAGQMPVALAPPPVPAGLRVIATGRMGELGTRLALEVCADKEVVKDFASKWAGDAYTLVEDSKHSLSLLWTTAWSGGASTNVANLFKLEPPCWEDEAAATASAFGWTIAAPSKTDVKGDLVAVARGSIDLNAAVARQLAVHPQTAASVPPLGEVAQLPIVPPALIENGRFVSAHLGLQGDLPRDYDPNAGNPVAEVSIQRAGQGSASLSFVPEALTGEALEAYFQTASAQIESAQGVRFTPAAKSQRKLAGVDAEERSWQVDGKEIQLRIDVAPWCGGKGALTLMRVESSEAARLPLERFVASIQKTGPAPVCAALE